MMEEQDNDKRQNQDDVIPGSQLDKMVNKPGENLPLTDRTGANHPIPTSGTVIIKKEDEDEDEQVQQ